jgi:hypothetical protein
MVAIPRLLAWVAVSLFLSACGESRTGELTRDLARELLVEHEKTDPDGFGRKIALWSGAYDAGVSQGFWTEDGVLTEKGSQSFAAVDRSALTLKEAIGPDVEVTGITDFQGTTSGMKQADITVSYESLPIPAKRFAAAKGQGEAVFRKYDDGWRVEMRGINFGAEGIVLSQAEAEAVTKDADAQSALIAAAQQAADAENARKAARLAESQRPKIPEARYACAPMKEGSNTISAEYWLTDVGLRSAATEMGFNGTTYHNSYWFGSIQSYELRSDGLYVSIPKTYDRYAVASLIISSKCSDYEALSASFDGKIKAWRETYPDLAPNSETPEVGH